MAAIVVEDGSIVANANSYLDIAALRLLALSNGVDLTAVTDEVLCGYLITAFEYLDSRESEFSGEVVESSQPSAWPRQNALIKCRIEIATDEIPDQLKAAQAFLVYQLNDGLELYRQVRGFDNDERGTYVSEETLGPLSIKTKAYPSSSSLGVSGGSTNPKDPICIPELEAILRPILNEASIGSEYVTVRV